MVPLLLAPFLTPIAGAVIAASSTVASSILLVKRNREEVRSRDAKLRNSIQDTLKMLDALKGVEDHGFQNDMDSFRRTLRRHVNCHHHGRDQVDLANTLSDWAAGVEWHINDMARRRVRVPVKFAERCRTLVEALVGIVRELRELAEYVRGSLLGHWFEL
ncbi:hypothetical protein L873DRAFT_1816378 [Choiromyces venosus 120613-1]|uniref:Fungal N-terminal domain-containing protein n=1 Tax=Choiromyces venosus 120613-1 TaxID=1336337 RepID=A0A3N4J798_9PEZI|nr:hypothetical protein L873DRAFT_1816378 [Choiromyces venosus 120613-1]